MKSKVNFWIVMYLIICISFGNIAWAYSDEYISSMTVNTIKEDVCDVSGNEDVNENQDNDIPDNNSETVSENVGKPVTSPVPAVENPAEDPTDVSSNDANHVPDVSGNTEITIKSGTTYNLTCNLEDGSYEGEESNPSTYVSGTTFTLINPVKSGYRFIGWTGSNGSTPEISVTISADMTGDLVYTANWEVEYTITYKMNGGSTSWSGSENPTSYTSSDGDILLINPTKLGYIFIGWSGDTGSTVAVKDLVIPAGSTGNKTLTANFQQCRVNLSNTGRYVSSPLSFIGSIDESRYKSGNGYVVEYGLNDTDGYYVNDLTVTASDGSTVDFVVETFDGGKKIKFNNTSNCYIYNIKVEYISYVTDWDIQVDTSNKTVRLAQYRGDGGDVVINDSYDIKGDLYKTLFESRYRSASPFYSNGNKITAFKANGSIKIKYSKEMFSPCTNIEKIDISGFDMTEPTSINYMFSGCEKLNQITWGPIDISKVDSLSYMFSNCKKLEDVSFLSSWDVKNIENMSNMFNGCESIKVLPIANWNTSQVTNLYYFCAFCKSLNNNDFISSWNLSSLSASSNDHMFYECDSLTDVDITLNLGKQNYSHDLNSMFGYCDNLKSAKINFNCQDGAKPVNIGSIFEHCQNLKTVKIKSSSGVCNFYAWFRMNDPYWQSNSLEKVEFDVPAVTWADININVGFISELFENVNNLKYLDLSFIEFDTVTSMTDNFKNCTGLEYLNLSNISFENLDTSNTNNIEMFKDLTSLAKFDTPKVKAAADIPLPHLMVDLEGNEYTVIPDTTKTIYKPFFIAYDLDGGTVPAVNPDNYTYDTPTFTLTNPTKENCKFLGWTEDDGVTIYKTVTIEKGSAKDHHFKAVWADSYTITSNISGKGKVEVVNRAYEDDAVSIIFKPASGYEFSSATITDAAGNEIPCTDNTFVMPASNVTIDANFDKKSTPPTDPVQPIVPNPEEKAYNITTDIHGKGTVDVVDKAYEGDTVFITITPAEGYKFKSVNVSDTDGHAIPFTNCFTMPASDVTVSVSFSEIKKAVEPVDPTPDDPEPDIPIPSEPVPDDPEPIKPVSPDESHESVINEVSETGNELESSHKSQCIIHFIILACMIAYVLLTMLTKKKSWRYRTIVLGVDAVIAAILVIFFRRCWLDLPALVLNLIVSTGFNVTKSILDTNDDEFEPEEISEKK